MHAEGHNSDDDKCGHLKLARVDNVSSSHKSERALKHKLCSRPMSLA